MNVTASGFRKPLHIPSWSKTADFTRNMFIKCWANCQRDWTSIWKQLNFTSTQIQKEISNFVRQKTLYLVLSNFLVSFSTFPLSSALFFTTLFPPAFTEEREHNSSFSWKSLNCERVRKCYSFYSLTRRFKTISKSYQTYQKKKSR